MKYTDEDQILMWLGTVQFTHLDVFEPMFLGQDYGTMLESLTAIPFHKAGLPLNISLPLASTILGLAPFVVMLYMALKEYNIGKYLLILFLMLCMSVDIDVLYSISRSFTPGYIFTVMGIFIIFLSDRKWLQALGGCLTWGGYVLSNTAICIILPFIVIYLFERIKRREINKIAFFVGGSSIALMVNQLFMQFYKLHPQFKVWKQDSLSFDFSLLLQRIKENFGAYYNDLFFIRIGMIFLFGSVVLIGVVVVFGRGINRWYSSLTLLMTLTGSILLLGFGKINLNDDTPLWSCSRMMLFIPINYCLSFSLFFPFKKILKTSVDSCMLPACYYNNKLAVQII